MSAVMWGFAVSFIKKFYIKHQVNKSNKMNLNEMNLNLIKLEVLFD